MSAAETDIARLRQIEVRARALLECVDFDNNGAMVGGQWMGGHGGLHSQETIKAADALRLALGEPK